jgi:tetratricopeptide (TPR) repeat protein
MAQGSPADPAHFFARVLADQHYQRGLQREQAGEWDGALAGYRRACALDPYNPLFFLARGHVCQTHGLEAEAEACYGVVLRLRPDDTVALYNQAQLFAARGDLEVARANLVRIVAGGVESLGERAAPIFCRLGDIALRREDYATAAVHFRRALECTPGHRYASAALGGLERFAEFRQPFDAAGGILPKVAFYGYAGAVLLGLPGDDGVAVPAYPGLGFDSLAELAQTLARFTDLARACDWRFDAVVALDATSRPLAIALADVLRARAVDEPAGCPRDARALAVSGGEATPAALAGVLGVVHQRASRTLFYAVGVSHPVWEYDPPVQVASAPGRLEYPWSRGEARAPEHAEAIGAELRAALAEAQPGAEGPERADGGRPDPAAQLAWYGPQSGHHRLGFSLRTLAPAGAGPAAPHGDESREASGGLPIRGGIPV